MFVTTIATYKLCYVSPCINPQAEGELYCDTHNTDSDYIEECSCQGCVRDAAKVWNRNAPHCNEEATSNKIVQNLFTGGHMQCLEELEADGTCPNAQNHHSVLIARLNRQTECWPGINHLGSCRC